MESTLCQCGCGSLIPKYASDGSLRKYRQGHQNKKRIPTPPMIECACGCGQERPMYDQKHRVRRYIDGHQNRNRPMTPERTAAVVQALESYRRLGHAPWNKGKTYIFKARQVYSHKHTWQMALKRLYGDRCMSCGWDQASCDAHHIEPRRSGGKYIIDNGVILCPNCHRLAENGKFSEEDLHAMRDASEKIGFEIIAVDR